MLPTFEKDNSHDMEKYINLLSSLHIYEKFMKQLRANKLTTVWTRNSRVTCVLLGKIAILNIIF